MSRELNEILDSGEVGPIRLQDSLAEIRLEGDARRYGRVFAPLLPLVHGGVDPLVIARPDPDGAYAEFLAPGNGSDPAESLRTVVEVPVDYSDSVPASITFRFAWWDENLFVGTPIEIQMLVNVMRPGAVSPVGGGLWVATLDSTQADAVKETAMSLAAPVPALQPGDMLMITIFRGNDAVAQKVRGLGLSIYYKKSGFGPATI